MSSTSPQRPTLLPSVFSHDDTIEFHQTTSQRGSHAHLEPSGHEPFDAPPQAQPGLIEGEDGNGEPAYPVAEEEGLLPPPNFAPFFTLIEDAATGEHYHPAVHYIFSDDDPELVTTASIRALGAGTQSPPADIAGSEVSGRQASALPPTRPRVQERYLILDLAPDGQTVERVQSLSPDWAVLNTTVGNAPTFGGDGEDKLEGSGLMLRIEGTGYDSGSQGRKKGPEELLGEARKAVGGDIFTAMQGEVEKLRRGMEMLGKVVGEVEEEKVQEERKGT